MKNISAKLNKYNQNHILQFENELTSQEKLELYSQVNNTDFSYLNEIGKEKNNQDVKIEPIDALTINQINLKKEQYKKIGLKALKDKKVGALLLAGGMGTRLGSNEPKGMYNIGKTKEVYIFQRLIENMLDVVKECGEYIPLFVMTSEHNDKITRKFLKDKNYFGYKEEYIKFFIQDMAPCTDFNGKILMESKSRIATSPNGNGGWFNSLLNDKDSREMLEKYNLEWINIFAVDNVLQKIADPVFIGATLENNVQIGAKVIRKADAFEKVGVMCKKNGRPSIIEYIDLGEEMATLTDKNGERLYNFGVILNYLFNVKLLYEIKDKKLPIHVVTKKIEHIDNSGLAVKPTEPNGHKFEMLSVDMIELASSCLPFEVEREKEFAPIKNKTGVDSVESAVELLEKNGYKL
ncbi:MAG: UTP--glucose-1-phosphate uridylyltransferase [Clostridia bacterium]|nr:UTP--glucose-1-phosphate uridylyltransferase [Clostridia bacterium]